jgi:hypothetical protein
MLRDWPDQNDETITKQIELKQYVDEEYLPETMKGLTTQARTYFFVDTKSMNLEEKSKSFKSDSGFHSTCAQSSGNPNLLRRFLNFIGCSNNTYINDNA